MVSKTIVKNLPANAGDLREVGSISGLGRSPGEGHGNPLQYSCLETPLDGGAWWVIVRKIAQSWTQLERLGPAKPNSSISVSGVE